MKTLPQNSEKERDKCGYFQNKLHQTTSRTIYTRATLHFLCIFLCSSRTFDQSHSLMEVHCANKLPGPPLRYH